MKKLWTVYILECANKTFYTGITTDIHRRMSQHKSGIGGGYTRAFGFKRLRWKESGHNHSSALKREAQIKKWPRRLKWVLIKDKHTSLLTRSLN